MEWQRKTRSLFQSLDILRIYNKSDIITNQTEPLSMTTVSQPPSQSLSLSLYLCKFLSTTDRIINQADSEPQICVIPGALNLTILARFDTGSVVVIVTVLNQRNTPTVPPWTLSSSLTVNLTLLTPNKASFSHLQSTKNQ